MRGKDRDPESLLAAARTDAEAFGAFYRLFERRILGYFMRATGSPEIAADLTAETFARTLEFVETYDPRKGRAEQWLFGIARNLLMSSFREGRVESAARERLHLPALIIDDHAAETISKLAAQQPGQAQTALDRLPRTQRQAIEAHIVDERDYEEIACELRCSEAVVRQRVSRGLRTLRARMAGER